MTPARSDHPSTALASLLGRWRGTTDIPAGPWGPARTVDAELTYRRLAGGFAVVQTYRHTETDGSHYEGHGIFTLDSQRQDVLWYYVDTMGPVPDGPARCVVHDGVLRVERRNDGGWTRHTLSVDGDLLTHVAEIRSGVASTLPDGGGYRPLMTSRYRRVADESGAEAE